MFLPIAALTHGVQVTSTPVRAPNANAYAYAERDDASGLAGQERGSGCPGPVRSWVDAVGTEDD